MATYFGQTTTPLGDVSVTENQYGVTSIRFSEAPPLDLRIDGGLQTDILSQIRAYFGGSRHIIEVPFQLEGPPFYRRVYEAVRRIPYGEARSYGEIALICGRPGAARAVGSAMSHCRLPLIIPCHRVIGAGRRLGGYSSSRMKRFLLDLEGTDYVRD